MRPLPATGAGILATALALLATEASACPACWSAEQGLNGGFYWSALLLTLLPFAVVASIGLWIGFATRRVFRRPASPAEDTR
jgi:hypothetical protein